MSLRYLWLKFRWNIFKQFYVTYRKIIFNFLQIEFAVDWKPGGFCRLQWCRDPTVSDGDRIIKPRVRFHRTPKHARGRIRFRRGGGQRESFTDHLWGWTIERRPVHTRRARVQSLFHDGLDAANAGEFESVFLVSVHEPDRRRVRRFVAALRPRASLRGLLSVSVRGTRRLQRGISVRTRFWKQLPLVPELRFRYRLHGSVRGGTPSSGVPVQPAAVAQIPPAPNRDDHHQTGQVSGANSAGTRESGKRQF